MDSREGIALQNQILELATNCSRCRAGGGAPVVRSAPVVVSGGSGDLTAMLLSRVTRWRTRSANSAAASTNTPIGSGRWTTSPSRSPT